MNELLNLIKERARTAEGGIFGLTSDELSRALDGAIVKLGENLANLTASDPEFTLRYTRLQAVRDEYKQLRDALS